MFSGPLPRYLEPRKLARQGGEISGQTPVAGLPGLAEFSGGRERVVRARLCFERDEEGHYCIRGEVKTVLELCCQRCLEPFEYSVEAEVSLALVWSQDQARALPAHLDPLLISEDQVELASLLEEELLLALPLVASHRQCPRPLDNPAADPGENMNEGSTRPDGENPFAVLERLKKDKGPRE